MATTLRNRSRRTQTYNLPHDPYCGEGTCRCVDIVQHSSVRDPSTGIVGMAQRPRKVAASVSFLPGEVKEGLPDTVLKCPDIAGAIARGELAAVKPAPPREEVKPPPAREEPKASSKRHIPPPADA
jgi:hypothetical protein